MVHEIHLGVAVAVATILIPIVVIASSVGSMPFSANSINIVQGAEAARPESLTKVYDSKNPMETLKQLYNDHAFAEIERCLSPTNSGSHSLCAETMEMLMATCDDRAIERITACDDPRLQLYRNRT